MSGNRDDHDHDEFRIGLYYCYTLIRVNEEVVWQKSLCEALSLKGRIRVSSEGLNGVLSGLCSNLERYEQETCAHLSITKAQLDLKYCELRKELEVKPQLFEELSVKPTREVISLHDPVVGRSSQETIHNTSDSKKYYRRRRRNRRKPIPQSKEAEDENNVESGYQPAPHLSPSEWNEQLLQHKQNGDAVLLDARNLYESRVGHFRVAGIPTLLPHTRKYSSLPRVLQEHKDQLKGKHVFMYCTGGVRCERASVYVQELLEGDAKSVNQLKGGIQRYLEEHCSQGNDEDDDANSSLFRGKNFCFDPRRTDPLVSDEADVVGQCVLCQAPHDDYDNGHAPRENREARCCHCRVLVLVCNKCRTNVLSWGEDDDDSRCRLYCGGAECAGEGNSPDMTILE